MAILGLCHMVRKLYYATVVEREGKESDEWQSFLTEARLWKLAKHQNPSVSVEQIGNSQKEPKEFN